MALLRTTQVLSSPHTKASSWSIDNSQFRVKGMLRLILPFQKDPCPHGGVYSALKNGPPTQKYGGAACPEKCICLFVRVFFCLHACVDELGMKSSSKSLIHGSCQRCMLFPWQQGNGRRPSRLATDIYYSLCTLTINLTHTLTRPHSSARTVHAKNNFTFVSQFMGEMHNYVWH